MGKLRQISELVKNRSKRGFREATEDLARNQLNFHGNNFLEKKILENFFLGKINFRIFWVWDLIVAQFYLFKNEGFWVLKVSPLVLCAGTWLSYCSAMFKASETGV